MAQVSRTAFASAVASLLADNSSGDISAADIRSLLTDLEDSATWYDEVANLAASVISSGTFANARISESSVTQHQSALTITESQISDLQAYLTAIADESVTFAKMQHIATDRILGRASASTGDVEALTAAQAFGIIEPIVSGAGTPSSTSTTPAFTNQVYFDTAAQQVYVATGTSSPADFTLVTTVSSQTLTGTLSFSGGVSKGQVLGGNTAAFAAVNSDTEATFPALGLASAAASDAGSVTIVTHGTVTGLDTQTPGWTPGTRLYVSNDPASDLGLTSTQPTSGRVQEVGIVLVEDSAAGVIFVSPKQDGDATITEQISVPASAWQPKATNGAEATTLAGTNVDVPVLAFDTTTQEYAYAAFSLPKGWNEGTVTAVVKWSHPATTTNFGVVWQLRARALGDSDAIDTAFSASVTATDTGGTTNDIFVSPATSALTIDGTPAENDLIVWELSRVVGNANDNMAVDARVHEVVISYTRNEVSDG